MALSLCGVETNHQGREIADHGTALFPIACYYDNLAKDTVPWHWHDELEAVVVEEGTALIAAGAQRYTVSKGEGFFINAGVLHAAWDVEDSQCLFHSVVFHPRLVGGGMDSIFWQNYICPLIGNISLKTVRFHEEPWHREAIGAIESAWQACAKEPPGYEFMIRNALSQLVFHLSGYQPKALGRPSEKNLRDGERIKTMLQFIQEHYGGEVSTLTIAASALISESECLRCFRTTIGTPPMQYVRQFRLQKAAELLGATGQNIGDIGAQCGFLDTSYFTKTFRQIMGSTPGEYRRKINEEKPK